MKDAPSFDAQATAPPPGGGPPDSASLSACEAFRTCGVFAGTPWSVQVSELPESRVRVVIQVDGKVPAGSWNEKVPATERIGQAVAAAVVATIHAHEGGGDHLPQPGSLQ